MAARLEVTLFWYRPLCICCVNQVVLMQTRYIYMTNAERSVSKQGHLQPRCHSKEGHWGDNCKMVYCLLTPAFQRMFLKLFKTTWLRLVVVKPIKQRSLFKHCFRYFSWWDVLFHSYWDFFMTDLSQRLGRHLLVTVKNSAKSTTRRDIHSLLATIYFLFCWLFMH